MKTVLFGKYTYSFLNQGNRIKSLIHIFMAFISSEISVNCFGAVTLAVEGLTMFCSINKLHIYNSFTFAEVADYMKNNIKVE